jgi:G protein-coupled receptor kinase
MSLTSLLSLSLSLYSYSTVVNLVFTDYEELLEFEKPIRAKLTSHLKSLFRPNTIGFYQFGRFLATTDDTSFTLLSKCFNRIEAFTKKPFKERKKEAQSIFDELKKVFVEAKVEVNTNNLLDALKDPVDTPKSANAVSTPSAASGLPGQVPPPEQDASPTDASAPAPATETKLSSAESADSTSAGPSTSTPKAADGKKSNARKSTALGGAQINNDIFVKIQSVIDRGSAPVALFKAVLYALAALMKPEQIQAFLSSPAYKRMIQADHYGLRKVKLKDFQVFRVLGRGAFGAVSAVQKIDTHAVYAMKQMNKKKIKREGMERIVVNEKRILQKMNSPFVLGLNYSFTTETDLYLIFGLYSGGDLKFHLRDHENRVTPFSVKRARLYAAEVLLGLEHIHSQSIVYRDCKPENILLDSEGHCKISDLGLAVKIREGKSLRHVAGTGGYWAPEIISKSGTTFASDLWSWGVLIYEMITGRRPKCKCDVAKKQWCTFGSSRAEEDMAQRRDGKYNVQIDYSHSALTPDLIDFLQLLFVEKPKDRIGAKSYREIKEHKFFRSLDWNLVYDMETTPDFVPDPHSVNAHSIADVGEFDTAEYNKEKLTDEDEKHYARFDYTSSWEAQEEIAKALLRMDNPPTSPADTVAGSSCCGGCTVM